MPYLNLRNSECRRLPIRTYNASYWSSWHIMLQSRELSSKFTMWPTVNMQGRTFIAVTLYTVGHRVQY